MVDQFGKGMGAMQRRIFEGQFASGHQTTQSQAESLDTGRR
jgi:hypothetical protein